MTELSDFDHGFLVGLLIGEGSFGGDGKQPQVTLRMHTRHEALFHWLMGRFPSIEALRALQPRWPLVLPVDGAWSDAGGRRPPAARGAHQRRPRRARGWSALTRCAGDTRRSSAVSAPGWQAPAMTERPSRLLRRLTRLADRFGLTNCRPSNCGDLARFSSTMSTRRRQCATRSRVTRRPSGRRAGGARVASRPIG